VLTSLWEGLPISVLEAMAASCPLVATNTGGIAEVVLEGRTGFLVPPRDINKMADKLSDLLKDENLRKQIGQNARDSLESNFTLENMVKNTENLYLNLIKKEIEGAN
jgi:glycosyltransferase involved in cell wall biosynthesis